jgi:RNA polymerase subunit RPABC4/transcription elongation factor Spt4
MATSPIQARCRRCQGDLYLFEVVEEKTGECPRCHSPLSPDWTPVLIDEARRADAAQRTLVASLRRLVGLPGNLDLVPYSVLRNLFEEVGWEQDLEAEPGLVQEGVRRLREQLDAWERLSPEDQEAQRGGLARTLQAWAARIGRAAPQHGGEAAGVSQSDR